MDRDEAEELLRTLFADPAGRPRRAQDVLVPDPDPALASIGHQVVGDRAARPGRHGRGAAGAACGAAAGAAVGRPRRAADVMATLGISLCVVGRMREGLRHLDEAVDGARRRAARRACSYRRAYVLGHLLARFEESCRGPAEGPRALRRRRATRCGRPARSTCRPCVDVELGEVESAAEAFARLRRDLGLPRRRCAVSPSPITTPGGWPSFAATCRARSSSTPPRPRASTRCGIDERRPRPRPGGCLPVGRARRRTPSPSSSHALVARPLQPRERGGPAGGGCRCGPRRGRLGPCRVGRRRGLVAAARTVPARPPAGGRPPRDHCPRPRPVSRPPRCCAGPSASSTGMREARAPQLPQALLARCTVWRAGSARPGRPRLGVRLARRGGVLPPRAHRLRCARSAGWRRPGRASAAGDSGGVLRACELGLRALDEHQATLGSQELRAGSAGHGAALAELGTRTAHVRRRCAAAAEVVGDGGGPPPSPRRRAALATTRRPRPTWRRCAPSAAASTRPAPTERPPMRSRRVPLGSSSRCAAGCFRSADPGRPPRPSTSVDLLEALAEDDTVLVELAELDGVLHALVAGRGRVRHRVVGDAAAAAAAVDFSLFTLRQAARGRRAQLEVAGARLERALLGGALDGVGESRVVVSGTAALQGVPWGLLPVARRTGPSPARRRRGCGCGRDRRGPRTRTVG